MYHKMTNHHLIQGFHKVKNHLGNIYNTTKNTLSNIDNGVKLFKHAYGIAHPLIDKYAGSNFNKAIMNGINSYDTIKSHALNMHNDAENTVNNLVKKQQHFKFA